MRWPWQRRKDLEADRRALHVMAFEAYAAAVQRAETWAEVTAAVEAYRREQALIDGGLGTTG